MYSNVVYDGEDSGVENFATANDDCYDNNVHPSSGVGDELRGLVHGSICDDKRVQRRDDRCICRLAGK